MLKKNKNSNNISFIDEATIDTQDKFSTFYKADSFFWSQLSNMLPTTTFSNLKKFLSLKLTQEEKIKTLEKKYQIDGLFSPLLSFKDNVGKHYFFKRLGMHIVKFILTSCVLFSLIFSIPFCIFIISLLFGIFFKIDPTNVFNLLGSIFFSKYAFLTELALVAAFYVLNHKDEIEKEKKLFFEYQNFLTEINSSHIDIKDLNVLDMLKNFQLYISNEQLDLMITSMEKEPREKFLVHNLFSIDNVSTIEHLDKLKDFSIINTLKEVEKEGNNIFSNMAMNKIFQQYITTLKNSQ